MIKYYIATENFALNFILFENGMYVWMFFSCAYCNANFPVIACPFHFVIK